VGRPAGYEANPFAFEAIQQLRGLSIAELARRSEVPRATISAVIGRHNDAGIEVVHKLAAALAVPPEALFPSLVPPRVKRVRKPVRRAA
jgi:transcriptional regulator with XRE-family HTH domain